MSRPTLVDLAVAEKISDTSWNLGRVASKLKWLGRGAAVLSGVIGAGDVYSATGSVWRAAGAGILNGAASWGLGALATMMIGTFGLPVLGAAAVVVGAAALGVVLGNVINAQFKKE